MTIESDGMTIPKWASAGWLHANTAINVNQTNIDFFINRLLCRKQKSHEGCRLRGERTFVALGFGKLY
jgi:hypothetical protein